MIQATVDPAPTSRACDVSTSPGRRTGGGMSGHPRDQVRVLGDPHFPSSWLNMIVRLVRLSNDHEPEGRGEGLHVVERRHRAVIHEIAGQPKQVGGVGLASFEAVVNRRAKAGRFRGAEVPFVLMDGFGELRDGHHGFTVGGAVRRLRIERMPFIRPMSPAATRVTADGQTETAVVTASPLAARLAADPSPAAGMKPSRYESMNASR